MNMRWVVAVVCFSSSFVLCSAAQVDVATVPSKAVYVAGEPVFIIVRIANTSAAPLTVVVPNPDSCLSAINVVVDGLRRSDLSPCLDPGISTCSYNGPPAELVEIKPQSSYEMRRLLNLIYDLHQPGKYRAHVHVHLEYADRPPFDQHYSYEHRDYESELTVEIVEGDADALQAALAPVMADLSSSDFGRQWYAQQVLLNLAPRFAEDRILAWADRPDLGQEAMAALRKLGTRISIEKLEATAFEEPDGNKQREPLRQAALDQIKHINDKSLLPKLYAITAEDKGQAIRWAAATAAARIGHGEAVPIIAKMLTNPDPLIAFAGAEALGDTTSSDAVGALISAIPSAKEDNKLPAIVEALTELTHRTTSSDPGDRMTIYQKWNAWWAVHHGNAEIYSPDSCGTSTQLK